MKRFFDSSVVYKSCFKEGKLNGYDRIKMLKAKFMLITSKMTEFTDMGVFI